MNRSATQLRTRQPTGKVAWPMIVVEGAEKVGKTYVSFALSASTHVGRTLVFDIGEGSGDEYATLGPYELAEHDGTWTDFLAQLEAATQLPADAGPPVIIIDSASMVWQWLKDWGEQRARSSKNGRKTLARDPDAEISIPMNIWTDIADRWGHMIHLLRHAPVISILICRGREVAKVDAAGQPVTGQTDYKIDAHKTVLFNATGHVRCLAPHKTKLMSVRSLHADVPDQGLALPDENPLAHVIFDVLGAGTGVAEFAITPAIEPVMERTVATAKQQLVAIFARAGIEPATKAAAAVWKSIDRLPTGGDKPISEDEWQRIAELAANQISDTASESAGGEQ